MIEYKNPFEYEQATKLSPQAVVEYYIEDFNYSRFVASKRNVLLVGERGTGKTMTFIYYSLPVQILRASKENKTVNLGLIPVYVPCNTPLIHRREYDLIHPLSASLASEHFMVISILTYLIDAVFKIPDLTTPEEEKFLRLEIEYSLNLQLIHDLPLDRALKLALDKLNKDIQESLNNAEEDIKKPFLSFNSGVRLFVSCLRQLSKLSNSHFSFMIDDAQLLNGYQSRALNSWIAFRDNALFSFKVATTRVDMPPMITASGGSILEGHDFIKIEMEQPYQNKASSFGKLASEIIQSRLKSVGVDVTPDDFFPINTSMLRDISDAKEQARQEAQKKYQNGTSKQINDYIYKYHRAIYFRSRHAKANLPPYSGFELLTHLSTGVIRNLLNPCFHMYDRIYSERNHNFSEGGSQSIVCIPPKIQTEVIGKLSKEKWEWIQNNLDNNIEGCSRTVAKRVYQMLNNLAILFKKRLLSDIAEPSAVEFTISGFDQSIHAELNEVLLIAMKAQLIYTYRSSAKDDGQRETYYMPNKMLWPDRGLDPFGQHARVSITANNLQNAAVNNVEIPFFKDNADEPSLFDPKN